MNTDTVRTIDDSARLSQALLILVVEDDPTQRLLTSSVLRSAGYEVVEAENGLAGLTLARQRQPKLIVCDVMMPKLNGYDLVTALKKDVALFTIPVIMLTAITQRTLVWTGVNVGADEYLSKPFRAADLQRSVQALLTKRRAQSPEYDCGSTKKVAPASL